jgi:hypothetical protein
MGCDQLHLPSLLSAKLIRNGLSLAPYWRYADRHGGTTIAATNCALSTQGLGCKAFQWSATRSFDLTAALSRTRRLADGVEWELPPSQLAVLKKLTARMLLR